MLGAVAAAFVGAGASSEVSDVADVCWVSSVGAPAERSGAAGGSDKTWFGVAAAGLVVEVRDDGRVAVPCFLGWAVMGATRTSSGATRVLPSAARVFASTTIWSPASKRKSAKEMGMSELTEKERRFPPSFFTI